ncbi:sodium:solute symporter family protein [Dyadobacter luticola]|uniref:Na+:solute symporter n=1 Tax=Dyadobacter luticola TaxID=1979387 RepID=A0A5R9KPV5_9BACT|nr:sodium:solute symporter family protein [Dyadobacter luticola]TLU98263.1 Na+:solute symporter [Dyadobacter luticola]
MKLKLIDFLVIIGYLIFVLIIGFILKKQAGRSKNDYLLGGKSIPFWMLGISNASGMFDISGTAWMVSIMFVYGVKSIWLPWLWPVFNQVFLMVYLSIWLRKSNASTGAEWMLTRFGSQKDGGLAHGIVTTFALISCLSFMTYAFVGLGKFIEIFLPWSIIQPYIPLNFSPENVPHFYGIVFTVFTVIYSLLGGMKSIVWADFVHYIIMVIISVAIAGIAIQALLGHESLPVPAGWKDLFFGKELGLDWDNYISVVNQKIQSDQFSPFGYFFALMAAKGILASLAGPVPSYDMQKILSAKTPREAALMSMVVNIVLLPTRYLLIAGVTVLGLLHFKDINISTPSGLDFEKILPAVVNLYIPPGLLGLVVVGLMGAFMSSFAGTFNAAQAYLLNDVYLKSISPKASEKDIKKVTYVLGVAIVIISTLTGLLVKDVNSTLLWIVSALYGGYIASNVLKFHWWRFNSYGFFAGMLTGILCAMICPALFPDTLPLFYFPVILLVSAVGAIVGSLLTPPTDLKVLKSFYKNIEPWGFWQPVVKMIREENPDFLPKNEFFKDSINVVFGIIAQTALTAIPVYAVLLMPSQTLAAIAIFSICAMALWKGWYLKLPVNK